MLDLAAKAKVDALLRDSRNNTGKKPEPKEDTTKLPAPEVTPPTPRPATEKPEAGPAPKEGPPNPPKPRPQQQHPVLMDPWEKKEQHKMPRHPRMPRKSRKQDQKPTQGKRRRPPRRQPQ